MEEELPKLGKKESQYKTQNVFFALPLYKIEREEEVLQRRNNLLDKFINEFGLPETMALKLLIACKWDPKKAENRFNNGEVEFKMEEDPGQPNKDVVTCGICMSDYNWQNDGYGLSCNHYFCNSCYGNHVNEELQLKGKNCVMSTCPGCSDVLPREAFDKFLSSDRKKVYNHYCVITFVDQVEDMRLCPGAGCNLIIHFTEAKFKNRVLNVVCECYYVSCSACGEPGHRPLNCEQGQKWNELRGGKSLDLNEKWIMANTKTCPKCKVPIQEIEGHCKHMQCMNCKHEFCWKCFETWKTHIARVQNNYTCDRMVPLNDPTLKAAERESRKYLFYSDFFEETMKSSDKVKRIEPEILKRYSFDAEALGNYQSTTLLKKALAGLQEARRQTAFIIVLEFFTKFTSAGQKALYELQLKDLLKLMQDMEDELTTILQLKENGLHFQAEGDIPKFRNNLEMRCEVLGNHVTSMINHLTTGGTPANNGDNGNGPSQDIEIEEEKHDDTPKYKHWECAKCTFVNKLDDTQCEVCKATSAGARMLE